MPVISSPPTLKTHKYFSLCLSSDMENKEDMNRSDHGLPSWISCDGEIVNNINNENERSDFEGSSTLHFGKRRRDININNNDDDEDGNLALCLSSSYNSSSSNIANTTSRNNKITSLDIQLSLSLPTPIPPPQDITGQQPDQQQQQQQTLISPPQYITSQQPVHHHRHQTLIPPPQDSTQQEVQDHGILIPPPQDITSQQQVLFHHDHGTLILPPQDIDTQQTAYHHHGTLIQPPNQVVMVPSAFSTVQSPISHHTPFGYCTTATANSDNSMNHHQQEAPTSRGSMLRAPRVRRNKAKSRREGTTESVPVLYPWATDKRATVHSLEYLRTKQIKTISGLVQCKKCDKQFEIEYNLEEKFAEMGSFIARYKSTMHDRAPSAWLNPVLPQCKYCNLENAARPVITDKKAINWLFLLLGQMLGCCTLEQLKYFCKYTKNHRTGAKDRVLYLTYLGLCKQLDPDGPFDR